MVSEVSITAYWTSHLFIDYFKHLIPKLFCILMSLAFYIEVFAGHINSFAALALLFLQYRWSAINLSYIIGFLFKSEGNAELKPSFSSFYYGNLILLKKKYPIIIFIFLKFFF
jgi:hypothetical protein